MQQYHFNSIVIIVFSILFFISIPSFLKDNNEAKLNIEKYSQLIFKDIPYSTITQFKKVILN